MWTLLPAFERSSIGSPILAIAALKGSRSNLAIPSLIVPAHDATETPMAATAANRCILMGMIVRTASMLVGLCGRKKHLCVYGHRGSETEVIGFLMVTEV
jgi:hypothetical protein